jgi:hypothetical protein
MTRSAVLLHWIFPKVRDQRELEAGGKGLKVPKDNMGAVGTEEHNAPWHPPADPSGQGSVPRLWLSAR